MIGGNGLKQHSASLHVLDISKNVKLNSDEYEIETASINDSEYTTDFHI